MGAGRPTTYTEKISKYICDEIASGRSLNSICKENKMPAIRTVYHWLCQEEHKDFLHMYTHARELQADTLFDQAIDIADDSVNDYIEKEYAKKEGTYKEFNHEHVSRARLRVDARFKVAAITRPRKYSEKRLHEHSGKDGEPLTITVNVKDE